MKKRALGAVAATALTLTAVGAVPVSADPGICPAGHVGSQIQIVRGIVDGPMAGPNSIVGWIVEPGAPDAPGQALKNICGPGSN